jgi:lactosylceramide 4-alpha-galactosyltransferase
MNRRIFLLLSIVSLIFVYFLIARTRKSPVDNIQCYHHRSDSLPDVSDLNPPKGKSIFFHETSCNSDLNGKIVITSRQACAVESAARLHPNYEVYLLYVSPGIFKFEGTESDTFLQTLISYKNVKIGHLDFERYVKDTPVEDLYKGGKIDKSKYPQSHASDVLRYLTLWKYGGIYADLDVIVIKSLEELAPNYSGAQSDSLVAAGVMSFAPTGAGHKLATLALKDLRDNFNGENWANNGPGVITRLSKKLCASEDVGSLVGQTCTGGFKVYPSKTFYPVPWEKWEMYFNHSQSAIVENLASDSYVVHFWNNLSAKTKMSVREEVPYSAFAKKYCPKVYSECSKFF